MAPERLWISSKQRRNQISPRGTGHASSWQLPNYNKTAAKKECASARERLVQM